MSNEFDIACAKAMGWEPYRTDGVDYYKVSPTAMMLATEFEPSSDLESARLLEDEIERRGLQEKYLVVLHEVVGAKWIDYGVMDVWSIFRATPEQKARAFLAAIGGGGGGDG